MWLFDDILKKPTSTQEGDLFINWGTTGIGETQSIPTIPVASGRDPESELEVPQVFKIEKTEGSSIFGNNTPPPEVVTTPTPIQTASGEDSLIIMSNNNTIQVQEPVQTITDTPSPVTVTENSLIETGTTSSPLIDIIQDQTPEVAISVPEVTTPISNESIIDPTPTSPNTTNDAIFGNFADFMTPPGELANPSVTQAVTQEEAISAPSLIETAPVVEMPIENQTETAIVEEGIEEKSWATSENSFFHPTEFIQKSISEIDTMIANIDQKHEKKIIEAEGYKAEKKRFTKLEEIAYTEAETMDEEKDHALHMKELLLNELPENKKKTEKNSHVETTLTGMAVVNTVEQTMEAPKHRTKTKLAA